MEKFIAFFFILVLALIGGCKKKPQIDNKRRVQQSPTKDVVIELPHLGPYDESRVPVEISFDQTVPCGSHLDFRSTIEKKGADSGWVRVYLLDAPNTSWKTTGGRTESASFNNRQSLDLSIDAPRHAGIYNAVLVDAKQQITLAIVHFTAE